ncbi:ribosomal RNA small subunit methyltransferase G [Alphaproteobacteria bacterium]|nr:ribosomal RNA small subunit methyltransferase G [Alphaproteobacteria bacterium]
MRANSRLQSFASLLQEWNASVNCLGRGESARLWERHILDSAQLLPHIPPGSTVVDVGSGAGLPGFVLAILDPSLHLVSVESDGKKAAVQRDIAARLPLDNARVIQERIENLPAIETDIIVSRAVAEVETLLALSSRLISARTRVLLLKTDQAREELETARKSGWQFSVDIFSSPCLAKGLLVALKDIKKE